MSSRFLAHLITSKFVDGLPFYRLQTVLARHEVAMPRGTQAAVTINAHAPVVPLLKLMDERMRASGYIRIDETPVQVLKSEANGTQQWMWVRVAGPPGQRYARQTRAVPLLDSLHTFSQSLQTRHWPRASSVRRSYLTKQWAKLIRYVYDGRIAIDTILAENAIRPFARGRRAWLFADTIKGAKASAAFFSLVETAKANGLGPYAYLCLSAACSIGCRTPGRSKTSKPCYPSAHSISQRNHGGEFSLTDFCAHAILALQTRAAIRAGGDRASAAEPAGTLRYG